MRKLRRSPFNPRRDRSGRGSEATPRRLALLCEHFYPEMVSTGMHMTELATRLAELGWRITVFTAKPSWGTDDDDGRPVPRDMVFEGVRIIRVPTLGSQRGGLLSKAAAAASFVPAAGWALWRHRSEYDGLMMTTNPPFVGLLGRAVTRFSGRPYLLIVYDVFPEFAVSLGVLSAHSWITKVWSRATRLILSGAAVTVVIGRDMGDLIRKKMPPRLHDRIVMIPNWSDERRVRPIPAEGNAFRAEHGLGGRFVVQYSGRLGEKHNLEPLIEAATQLRDTNVLFQFIGEGAKKAKLQALVADAGLANVHFLPYQPMHRLAETLSAPDVSVVCLEAGHTGISVPSKAYGILASGTPMIGLLDPDSEIGQMIKETGCGELVAPDGAEIADVIRDLMADPTRCAAMGDAGRAVFLEAYTLEKAAAAYGRALASMMSPRTR